MVLYFKSKYKSISLHSNYYNYDIIYVGDFMIKNVLSFVHELIEDHVDKDAVCIDATLGNGHDALKLAKYCKKVYAFDIQEQALSTSKVLFLEHSVDNIEMILDSHENIKNYVTEEVRFVTFNLGYLPGSDKSIITRSESTKKAIIQCLDLLHKGGVIAITIYIGHPGGKEEAVELERYIELLDSKEYKVLKYQFINRNNAPYTIIIEKQ